MQHDAAIRNAFRLTAAESRLALRLLTGESVRSAAAALGITYESARSHLKSIFHKTGTHRQGELIVLLARTIGGLEAHSVPPAAQKDRGQESPNGG
jgi:DNA-binding CsgD family transcriptional regulator